MTRIDAALLALIDAQKAVRKATDALRRAETLERVCRDEYTKARPLTESEREELAVRATSGGALCCAAGLAWLRERLPDPWAFALNEWAYDALGCSQPRSAEERNADAARVRGLKLDRFPP